MTRRRDTSPRRTASSPGSGTAEPTAGITPDEPTTEPTTDGLTLEPTLEPTTGETLESSPTVTVAYTATTESTATFTDVPPSETATPEPTETATPEPTETATTEPTEEQPTVESTESGPTPEPTQEGSTEPPEETSIAPTAGEPVVPPTSTPTAGVTPTPTPTAMPTNGETLHWVLSDHLGSTSTTANEDGSWNSTIQYTAFGEIRLTKNTTPTKYRYTGQLDQAELGLDYYVARFYDPQTGHFTQADSIIPGPGKASAFDRYAYVLNNPIRNIDPTGHICKQYVGDTCVAYSNDSWISPEVGINPENNEAANRERHNGSKLSLSFTAGFAGEVFTYGSFDLIQDNNGMVALFYTWRDIDFHSENPLNVDLNIMPEKGEAEQYLEGVAKFFHITSHETPLLPGASPQIGIGITGGRIFGESFTKYGVDSYAGQSIQIAGAINILGGDIYTSFDPIANMPTTSLYGYDVGFSYGQPTGSGSIIATRNFLITKFQLPPLLVEVCKLAQGCGE